MVARPVTGSYEGTTSSGEVAHPSARSSYPIMTHKTGRDKICLSLPGKGLRLSLRAQRRRVLFEPGELLEEVVLVDAHRALEEDRKLLENPALPAALCEQREAGQVDHKGRRQER